MMSNGDFTQFLTALGAFESGIDTTQTQTASYMQFLRVFDPQYGNVPANSVNLSNSADLAFLQYHVFNTLGFMGKYQFGEPLLIDLGYYVPASSGFYGTTATNEWQGTWTGKNGVFSKADFMSNVQELAVREAFTMNIGIINDYLGQAGKTIDDFLGHTFTYSRLGEAHVATVTMSGILASAHLQGPGGVAQLLLHNVASSDEYGTNILFYMDKFGNYASPFGTGGDDFLSGSDFSETFMGGAGHNVYHTGDGYDKIVITNKVGGSDVIQDFDISKDVISLTQFPGLAFKDLAITTVNGHAHITFPDGQTIDLLNVAATQVNAKGFVSGPYKITWNANSGDTHITNFSTKYDVIDLNYAFASSNIKLYDDHGSTVIDIVGNNQRVILDGVPLTDISAASFIKAPVDFATVEFGVNANHTAPVVPPVVTPPVVDTGQTSGTSTVAGSTQQGTAGSDVFSYNWNWGSHAVVNQFNVATDKIDLKSFWTSFDQFSLHNDAEGNAVIDLTNINNQTITLQGISANSLTASNFVGVTGVLHVDGASVAPVTPVTPVTPIIPPADTSAHGHEYSYTWNWGSNVVIQSFDVTKDVVNLKSFWTSFDQISIHNNAQGSAVIDMTALNNQTITLQGISSASLSSQNIVGVTGTISQALTGSAVDTTQHSGNNTSTGGTTVVPPTTLDVVNHNMNDSSLVGRDGVKDVFSFSWSWGSNKTITGFNSAEDQVDLKQFWTTADHVSIHNDAHGNAVVDLTALNNQTITLLGVSTDHLHSNNVLV